MSRYADIVRPAAPFWNAKRRRRLLLGALAAAVAAMPYIGDGAPLAKPVSPHVKAMREFCAMPGRPYRYASQCAAANAGVEL